MAPPAVSWSDGLTVDLLLLVLLHLHCLADRASFAAVCRSWRQAQLLHCQRLAQGLVPPPRQISWLLSPSASPSRGPSITSFLSGSMRRIRSLPADLSRARLCGSYPGGWFAAVLGPCGGHVLANLFSDARIGLPHRMRLATFRFSSVTPIIVRAVVLSAAPDTGRCVAGAIVCGSSNVAFCRPGVDQYWTACDPEVSTFQDMVYYEGEALRGFHVLSANGNVGVFITDANAGRGDPFVIARDRYYIIGKHYLVGLLPLLPNSTSVTRYLVVSRQQLLMVVRYYCQEGAGGVCRTLLFRVFEMQAVTPSETFHWASWVEMGNLDCRVLFVGRGCSRAYEASELQGFTEGSVYFLDDANFDVSLALGNASEYPCRDVGMYSMSAATGRPSLGAPVYGAKTYLSVVDDKASNEAGNKVLVETKEEEALPTASKMLGTRWNFPSSQPFSKFSPPIWFAP
ncbi:hypothetical protein EJB05_15650, partial [Eragrostis curvula]